MIVILKTIIRRKQWAGKIAQVVGPVVDVAFAAGDKLPEINNALVVYTDEQKSKRIVLEVALELGEGVVRTMPWNLLMDWLVD